MTKSVFISSTFEDLGEYRKAVHQAIVSLENKPIDMLYWGAEPDTPLKVSLRKVRKSDYFVGIIAYRYGTIPNGSVISITQMEYEEAVKRKKPRFMYLVDPKYEWPDELKEHNLKLNAFITTIKNENTPGYFNTPDDLRATVATNLARYIQEERSKQNHFRCIVFSLLLLVIIIFMLIVNENFRKTVIEISGLASNTPTPTLTFTPTATPIPTSTPLEGNSFSDDEVGVIIANFERIDDGAPHTEPGLEDNLSLAGADYVHINHLLTDREHAKEVSDLYNATIVIWGEVQEGGVKVYFEVTPRRGYVDTTVEELRVSASDLTSFEGYIFDGMDSLYIVDFVLGQIHYYEGEYNEALAVFNRAVERIPIGREQDLQAEALFFYRGNTYANLGNYEAAVENYTSVLNLEPENSLAFNNRGVAYHETGDYERATSDYDWATSLDPQYAAAYNNRGAANAKLGKFDEAMTDFEKAIEADSEFANPYFNRGFAYIELGQYEYAITDFSEAIERDPNPWLAYYNRGVAYHTLKIYNLALEDFGMAISLNPDFEMAYNFRGTIYGEMEEYELALADFNKAIDLNGEYAVAYTNLGNTYYLLGLYELALSNFNESLNLEPTLAETYLNRGLLYLDTPGFQNCELARADLEFYLELVPNDPQAETIQIALIVLCSEN